MLHFRGLKPAVKLVLLVCIVCACPYVLFVRALMFCLCVPLCYFLLSPFLSISLNFIVVNFSLSVIFYHFFPLTFVALFIMSLKLFCFYLIFWVQNFLSSFSSIIFIYLIDGRSLKSIS